MVVSSATGNAGFLASRNLTSKIVSFDLLDNVNPATGWSIQMQASNENLAVVDRVNGVNLLYLTSGIGLTVNGGITTTGDIEITDSTKGIILNSPGGARYRIKVDDAGNLSTEIVA